MPLRCWISLSGSRTGLPPPISTSVPSTRAPRLRLVASRVGAILRTQAHLDLLGRCRAQRRHLSAPPDETASPLPATCAVWKQFQITHSRCMFLVLLDWGSGWLTSAGKAPAWPAARNRTPCRGEGEREPSDLEARSARAHDRGTGNPALIPRRGGGPGRRRAFSLAVWRVRRGGGPERTISCV